MLNPRLILLVLAIAVAAPSWATVPQALSFQGYLTDRVGSPIVDSQTIKFSIYTVPVGGVPVWEETKSVAFSNGLFSTRLGELTSFPPDLFDVPLWIGMTVGTDSEMEPRRSLTTAGFSFRSEDSDTLQGQSAAELDQSGHVDDLSNPHVVTAGQTGAATQTGLDSHTGDTGNPHAVSVGQTGGTPAGTFNVHAADGSAHHARYADAESVAAMGIQDSSNPLNHSRYTNGETVAAVLAADGEGSGLDADTVDGLDSNQLGVGSKLAVGPDVLGTIFGIHIGGSTAPIFDFLTMNLALVTSSGYLVEGELYNPGATQDLLFSIPPIRLRFTGPACSGQAFIYVTNSGQVNLTAARVQHGFIFMNSNQLYYVPRRAVFGNFTQVSKLEDGGDCVSSSGSLFTGYAVFLSSVDVTGIPAELSGGVTFQ